jgi:hypothetical protein
MMRDTMHVSFPAWRAALGRNDSRWKNEGDAWCVVAPVAAGRR